MILNISLFGASLNDDNNNQKHGIKRLEQQHFEQFINSGNRITSRFSKRMNVKVILREIILLCITT